MTLSEWVAYGQKLLSWTTESAQVRRLAARVNHDETQDVKCAMSGPKKQNKHLVVWCAWQKNALATMQFHCDLCSRCRATMQTLLALETTTTADSGRGRRLRRLRQLRLLRLRRRQRSAPWSVALSAAGRIMNLKAKWFWGFCIILSAVILVERWGIYEEEEEAREEASKRESTKKKKKKKKNRNKRGRVRERERERERNTETQKVGKCEEREWGIGRGGGTKKYRRKTRKRWRLSGREEELEDRRRRRRRRRRNASHSCEVGQTNSWGSTFVN